MPPGFFVPPSNVNKPHVHPQSPKATVLPFTGTTNAMTTRASSRTNALPVHKKALPKCTLRQYAENPSPPTPPPNPPSPVANHPPLLNLPRLRDYLSSYTNDESQFLISGFEYGFLLNFSGKIIPRRCPNLKSAIENPDVLKNKLIAELAKN